MEQLGLRIGIKLHIVNEAKYETGECGMQIILTAFHHPHPRQLANKRFDLADHLIAIPFKL
jgi:hypothetical protein